MADSAGMDTPLRQRFLRQSVLTTEVRTWHSQEVFRSAGVKAPVQVVPEPVDVAFFSPEGVDPLPLPAGQLVFGQPLDQGRAHTKFLSASGALHSSNCLLSCPAIHVDWRLHGRPDATLVIGTQRDPARLVLVDRL